MWEIQILDRDSGEWCSLGINTPGGFVAYRYDFSGDARAMLDRLHPKLRWETEKRLLKV